VRWIGLMLALAALGAAGGYAAAVASRVGPTDFSGPTPVPAASPSYPVNEYDVCTDPGFAPLPSDLPRHPARFAAGELRLTAEVPDGWRRFALSGGTSWNFTDPDNPTNTYLLRVDLYPGNRESARVQVQSRIAALRDAQRNGDLQRVEVEDRTDESLRANYISACYYRVTMQQWLQLPGASGAFASIAITGRDSDREGMADLLERVVASATP
jgi:hypothetical protein